MAPLESESIRVVGIDLTGSEKRPTGWACLSGDTVETQRVSSDQDLISKTIAAKPDIVSIDSPLSLPSGRQTVWNSDPARSEHGITRECERILKRRGVNVYPSLIDSMQALTKRGIWLAKELRSYGIPVIESFPGAAQDIVGLPRKKTSLDLLKKGLSGFGLNGDFQRPDVSHDEIDAITSAIVGVFFWGGRFEALGNAEEEYLIVPDLNQNPRHWLGRRVLGFSGRIASGKTTISHVVEDRYAYEYCRFSLVLADLLEKKGRSVNRKNLQEIGRTVNEEFGQRWLCQKLVEKVSDASKIVIDGLRFPEDHAFMVEAFGPSFVHVHITATRRNRMDRYLELGYSERDFESADRHKVERSVSKLKGLATYRIANNGTLKNTIASLEGVRFRSQGCGL